MTGKLEGFPDFEYNQGAKKTHYMEIVATAFDGFWSESLLHDGSHSKLIRRTLQRIEVLSLDHTQNVSNQS
jgi:hypothetical protein